MSAPTIDAAAAGEPIRLLPWGPPGISLYFVTALAILMALDANTRGSFSMSVLATVASVIVAGIWLTRFVHAGWTSRLRMSAGHWLRWLAIPVVVAAALAVTTTDIPSDVRLSASRGAMDEAAAEIIAGGTTDRGWIGLYPVEAVERTANGMRFLISDAGFIDRSGFAYAPDGQPAGIDGTDEYRSIGGGWWLWTAKFN